MASIRRTLVVCAAASLTLAGLAAPAAAKGHNPNDPAFYGEDCTKVEYVDSDSDTFVVPANTTVYVKAGTVIYTFTAGQVVVVPKDISYVISCPTPYSQPS